MYVTSPNSAPTTALGQSLQAPQPPQPVSDDAASVAKSAASVLSQLLAIQGKLFGGEPTAGQSRPQPSCVAGWIYDAGSFLAEAQSVADSILSRL